MNRKEKRKAQAKLKKAKKANETPKKGFPVDTAMAALVAIDPRIVFDPSASGVHEHLQRFMLILALMFNDMKGLQYLWAQAQKFRMDVIYPPSAQDGNWSGMKLQLLRNCCGFTHELLDAIKKVDTKAIKTDEFADLVSRSSLECQKAWSDVLAVARDAKSDNFQQQAPAETFRNQLRRLRNRSAYHWDPSVIENGFKNFFLDSPSHPHNVAAFVSFGSNLAQTRFFFADAAAEGSFKKETGQDVNQWFGELGSFFEKLNIALNGLLRAFYGRASQTHKNR